MKAIRWLVTLSLGFALCLAGCGGTTANTAENPPATATTAVPTTVPTSMSQPTPNASQLAACGLHSASGVVSLGDLLITGLGFSNLAYPSRKLPEGTPLAPFKLATGAPLNAQLPDIPAVNPNLTAGSGGYSLSICNSSPTTTHVIRSVGVRIASATPYSGVLDAWNSCDGNYNAATKQGGEAGCGGGFCANETLNATFDTTTAGADASVTAVASDKEVAGGCGLVIFGPLPVSLKPHQTIGVNIGVTLQSTPATYTFALGVAQDSAAPSYLPASQPTLLAPVTHKWTGAACATSKMQSQIPPAGTPTYYICPAL